MKRKLFILFITATLQSCEHQNTGINKLSWLEGSWAHLDSSGNFYEEWRLSGKQLQGQAYVLKGTDTAFGEKLRILERNDTVFYIADINENKTAEFFATKATDSLARFELPENDFPSAITYRKLDKNEIHVILEGSKNRMEMSFVRQK